MSGTSLPIGTFGPTEPPTAQFVDTTLNIESKGWDSLWWGDHFMGWFPQSVWTPDLVEVADVQETPHSFFETLSTMGFAAAKTDSVTLGTMVTEPLRRHPVMLAQAFLTLHHLSRGRTVFGVGPGERENVTPYGIDFAWQVSKLEEALEIIRLAWGTPPRETFDYDGRFWTMEDAVFGLPPLEGEEVKPYPDIWLGAHGPRMLSLTGAHADGWIPSCLPVDAYRSAQDTVTKSARDAGRDPDEITRGLSTKVVIDETTAAAEELLDSLLLRLDCLAMLPEDVFETYGREHPLGSDYGGMSDYVPSRLGREEAIRAAEQIPIQAIKDHYLWGSPDDIADQIETYLNAGLEHLILINQTYLADVDKLGASFGHIDEVRQRFN